MNKIQLARDIEENKEKFYELYWMEKEDWIN